jgi:hypothetical protein
VAGYSGTPLVKKLGIEPGCTLGVIDEPTTFRAALGPLDDSVVCRSDVRTACDVVVAFFDRRRELERRLPALTRAIFPDGRLWIAWPKKASKVPTDITEDVVRSVALPTGLVDNKVCAIDDVWSGLQLVVRRTERERAPGRR